jgi:hypothetical protein
MGICWWGLWVRKIPGVHFAPFFFPGQIRAFPFTVFAVIHLPWCLLISEHGPFKLTTRNAVALVQYCDEIFSGWDVCSLAETKYLSDESLSTGQGSFFWYAIGHAF